MIPTLLRIATTNLRRDRVVQAMTFFLPIAFFSIFAGIFGSQGRDVTSRIHVAVVDEDRSEVSGRLVAALLAETGLRIRTRARRPGEPDTARTVISRLRALDLVKNGDVPVAIVIPKGFGAGFGGARDSAPSIELLSDRADPVAPQVVSGLLQKTVMTGVPDVFARQGLGLFEKYGGGLTPQQRQAMESWTATLKDSAGGSGGPARTGGQSTMGGGMVPVTVVDVLGEKKSNPLIALTAAGIAVMFLLFSASGAGGTLLDEVETGTLERLLTSHAGMGTILVGKWLFIVMLGVFQITVMFVWGMVVFKLDLLGHLPGFFTMTFFTAAAAAGFGLVLATLCKSRQQLGGLSTILILTQSAVGGSMFPRFAMNEQLRAVGRFTTFNANALDGYEKVFWREARLVDLWPQVLVLAVLTILFLILARLLARRWETV
jgi:linearmycin/streptolysin S transport system permease protein